MAVTTKKIQVAVADDRAALVTSWNFLSKANATAEVGVIVRSPRAGSGSAPVRDLLRWARTAVPGYDMSRQLLVEEQAFSPVGGLSETIQPPPTPAPPPGEDREGGRF